MSSPNSQLIHLGLIGASGKMGQWVLRCAQTEFQSHIKITTCINRFDSEKSDLLNSEVLIDFSSPSTLLKIAKHALKHPHPLPAFIIGTTGWESKDFEEVLMPLAQKTKVFIAANFSIGIALLCEIFKSIRPVIDLLQYQTRIQETHHVSKKDTPSGTALWLQKSLVPEKTPIQSIRLADTLGIHAISLENLTEKIEITHQTLDRSLFARNALKIAIWLVEQHHSGKLLSMEDYLQSILSRGNIHELNF